MLPTLLITLIFAYFIYAIHKLDLHRPALEALCKPVGDWFGEAGNPVTAALWIVVSILLWVAWFGSEDSIFYKLQGEITGMAFTVIVIDWLVDYRTGLQEKKRIIRQLSSQSNAHALEAARLIASEEWHKDGSLIGMNFSGANLKTVDFCRASLDGVDLSWSKLQDAQLTETNLKGANLSHADLTDAWLVGADLSGATLFGANLTRAKLWNTKFNDANLTKAILIDSECVWANFRGTKLKSAEISITQIKVVPDIFFAPGFRGAAYDLNTQWPDGFDPIAAGAIKVDD